MSACSRQRLNGGYLHRLPINVDAPVVFQERLALHCILRSWIAGALLALDPERVVLGDDGGPGIAKRHPAHTACRYLVARNRQYRADN